jgi:thiol:disulfide interchange protein
VANSNQSNIKWVFLIFVGVFAIVYFSRQSNGIIPWQTNYAAASTEARTDHKLVLLDFYANWCGPCRTMAADTWSDKHVADAVADLVPVHVNVDDDPALSQHFGVQGIPNVVLVDGNGTVVAQHVGQMRPGEFLAWLHYARTGY